MFNKINQEKKQDNYRCKRTKTSKTLILILIYIDLHLKCKHGIEARKLQNAKDERRSIRSKMEPRQNNSKTQKGVVQKAIKE